jgi:L-alanine-DL-glutamate epimerase-like enolase superfamily enzyme
MVAYIKAIHIVVLSYPTSHYISGWRLITRTFHLVTFLVTNTGVISLGEGTPYGSNIVEDYTKALSLAKIIQGLALEDALDTLRLKEYEEFRRKKHLNYGAYLAMESAVLHALSLYRKVKYEAEALGGIYRIEIPVAYTIFLNHPKIMAWKLEKAVKLGFKHIKFKIPCKFEELEKLLEYIYFIRKQNDIEDLVLRADANECFTTFESAVKALALMEKRGVNIVEQPMPRDRLRETAKLRKKFYPSLEIMLDESLRKPSDIKLFAQIEAADAINFHPSKLGCLTITREAVLETQKLGMKANLGSALMTEIGLFHYLNLAASVPRLDYPLEELGLCNVYGYSIVQEPLIITNGYVKLFNISISNLDFDVFKIFSINCLFKEHFLIRVIKFIKHTIISD